MKKKTIYGLRLRATDADEWGQTNWFKTAKARDKAASYNRILAGFRTWSFNDRKTLEEIEEIDFA